MRADCSSTAMGTISAQLKEGGVAAFGKTTGKMAGLACLLPEAARDRRSSSA